MPPLRVTWAGAGERLVAAVSDLAMQIVVLILTSMVMSWLRIPLGHSVAEKVLPTALVGMLVAYSGLELRGLSPGKFIGNLRIVAADGFRASAGQLAIRWAVKHLPLLLLLAAAALQTLAEWRVQQPHPAVQPLLTASGITALFIIATGVLIFLPDKRALYDHIAGTRVVRRWLVRVDARPLAGGAFEIQPASPQEQTNVHMSGNGD